MKSDCPSPVVDHNGKQGCWSSSSWHWWFATSEAACLCSLLMCALQDKRIWRSCRGVQQAEDREGLCAGASGSTGGSWACSLCCRRRGLRAEPVERSCKDHWMWTICSSTRWQQPEIAGWEVEHEFWPGMQCVTGAAAWWGLEPSFLEIFQSLLRESMTDTAINGCLLRLWMWKQDIKKSWEAVVFLSGKCEKCFICHHFISVCNLFLLESTFFEDWQALWGIINSTYLRKPSSAEVLLVVRDDKIRMCSSSNSELFLIW